MTDYTNNFMDQLFGTQKSQNPLDEANKAIKKIKELNEKIQKNQKEITTLKAQLAQRATESSPTGKKVDRILGISPTRLKIYQEFLVMPRIQYA